MGIIAVQKYEAEKVNEFCGGFNNILNNMVRETSAC